MHKLSGLRRRRPSQGRGRSACLQGLGGRARHLSRAGGARPPQESAFGTIRAAVALDKQKGDVDNGAQPRATWKGYLKIAELSCPIALYAAASSSERIALHTISRETHHRLRRQFVDSETGKPVEREDQAKGYEVGKDEYVMLDAGRGRVGGAAERQDALRCGVRRSRFGRRSLFRPAILSRRVGSGRGRGLRPHPRRP